MKINSVIPYRKEKNDNLMKENSFSNYISASLNNYVFEKEELMEETILSLNEKSKDNQNREEKFQEEENSSKGLILKELPKHLKYAFLGK